MQFLITTSWLRCFVLRDASCISREIIAYTSVAVAYYQNAVLPCTGRHVVPDTQLRYADTRSARRILRSTRHMFLLSVTETGILHFFI